MNHAHVNTKMDFALVIAIVIAFLVKILFPPAIYFLWPVVVLGALPTLIGAVQSTLKARISIDSFNIFAICAAFAYGDVNSATFIILMLAFARMLNAYTESRTRRTLEELFKLKPQTALREKGADTEEIPTDAISMGDTLLIKEGSRVPVDGITIFGKALVNESSVTGESMPVEKVVGDQVLSATVNESGLIKIRATRVGKDSTIERMAALVADAAKKKSHSEQLADRFATIFLPIVLALGIGTYVITRNIEMTAALFLVACADDMAVAIPLAITAALGRSAKRGVVVKGGEWIETLSKLKTLVIDKTGTLTYGSFELKDIEIEPGISTDDFWRAVGVTEKFSEHPIGRTIFKEAIKHGSDFPDPEEFKVYKGSGVTARVKGEAIAIGDFSIISDLAIALSEEEKSRIKKKIEGSDKTWAIVFRNGKIWGYLSMGDMPRPEARESIADLQSLGVDNIQMFTGDNKLVAGAIARAIGIDKVLAEMKPEEKLRELEKLIGGGPVAMVGDGINDAAALARADVGIAMGSGGAAVSVEAADVVILNDDLSRLPDTISYSRKVMSVIRWDMIIWFASNVIGFALVFTGVLGPALAAFYNFVSDFFPLINSARLFREKS
ncbi:MAG: cation-translocating P-type ATPase [Candidatus Taylorbacteria bacterium]